MTSSSVPINSSLTISEVMSANPLTIEVDATLAQAAELFCQYHYLHLPVLEKGALKGILTHRDLYLTAANRLLSLDKLFVRDAFVDLAYQVSPKTLLTTVLEAMLELQIGSALVVEDRKLLGIFTGRDALRVLHRKLLAV